MWCYLNAPRSQNDRVKANRTKKSLSTVVISPCQAPAGSVTLFSTKINATIYTLRRTVVFTVEELNVKSCFLNDKGGKKGEPEFDVVFKRR